MCLEESSCPFTRDALNFRLTKNICRAAPPSSVHASPLPQPSTLRHVTLCSIKATCTIVLLKFLFSLPLFVFVLGIFVLSLIVLCQKSSPALSFVDGWQDKWTRNINICVGMSQWRLTPEASESKNRERKDEGLSHFLVSAAQFFVLLTTGWPDLPRLWMWERALVCLSFLPFDVNV